MTSQVNFVDKRIKNKQTIILKKGVPLLSTYSFDQLINRTGTQSVKWDKTDLVFGAKDVLPFWVADMDFQAPPNVLQTINERVKHGIFGYTSPTESTANALSSWVEKKHQWTIDHEWITYSPGVVFALSMAIQAFTEPGDSILIQPPVYTPFFNMIKVNDREVVENPLKLAGDKYEIDFADLEQKFAEGVKLMILCSPHNPVGRVWTKEELKKLADLCEKYNVLIVSDEIHSDLIYQPYKHIPISMVSEDAANRTITCMAPSKTFNIPGLQASAIIIPNEKLRTQYAQQQQKQGFSNLNTFGIIGLEAAYSEGEEWLEALLVYLKKNVDLVTRFISENLPELRVVQPEGTYLLWIDCNKLHLSEEELHERLLEKGKIAVEKGEKYSSTYGKGFIRLNIGCSHEQLQEGLNRLKVALT